MHEIVEVTNTIDSEKREQAKASCSCQKNLGNGVFAHALASLPLKHHNGTLTETQLEIFQQEVDKHTALPGKHSITVTYQKRP